MDKHKIDPGHSGPRDFCRVVGPVLIGIGAIFMIIGIGSFFIAFGSFGSPRYFWCAFVGMPFLAIGSFLTRFGYMGKVARYMAEEMAPVAKDTFNYMADGTQDGVKTMTRAVAEGLTEGGISLGGSTETKVRCHKCNELIDEDARFCDQCGAPTGKSKPCPSCSEMNDPDAKFCDNCGYRY